MLFLFLLAGGVVQGNDAAVATIPVVHTWGDLFATTPVVVDSRGAVFADGTKAAARPAQVSVWLGIDRTSANAQGAVLLYCASKDVAFPSDATSGLGPFSVVVHPPKDAPDQARMQMMQMIRARMMQQAPVPNRPFAVALAAHMVPVNAPGDYEIEVMQDAAMGNPRPKVIARATVKVSADPAESWMPWGEPSGDAALMPLQQTDSKQADAAVSNPAGGTGLPVCPQEGLQFDRAPDNATPLPPLIPSQPDPKAQMKIAGDSLVLTGEHLKWMFPADYFLTRWWVNGKPYAVAVRALNESGGRAWDGAVPNEDPASVRFRLDFHPERLGLRKGDKVSVQLLNCPGGYQRNDDNIGFGGGRIFFNRPVLAGKAETPLASISILSNRVDFVYPGEAAGAAVTVVHSWSELLATKPIEIESEHAILPGVDANGSKAPVTEQVWVGIDRDHTTCQSAVLLYCAAKGVAFQQGFEGNLGPFRVEVQGPEPEQNSFNIAQEQVLPPFGPSTFVLSTHSVPVNVAGLYMIKLYQRYQADFAPKLMAEIAVHVAGNPVNPWSPWSEPDQPGVQMGVQPWTNEGDMVRIDVSNPNGGTGVPDAMRGPFFYPEELVRYMALPQLMPGADDDPNARLSVRGDNLVLEAKDLQWESPLQRCLTRWWINDKPILPGALQGFQQLWGGGGQQRDENPTAIHYHLEFAPERLGAKKGDRIGVQLLYCPKGTHVWGLPDYGMEAATLSLVPPSYLSSISNRIDFVYSGNPKKPVVQ